LIIILDSAIIIPEASIVMYLMNRGIQCLRIMEGA
jgi:hypothetical protein